VVKVTIVTKEKSLNPYFFDRRFIEGKFAAAA
jgi:hypothetical protein